MNVVVLGNGEKIINQYPKAGVKVNKIDKIFLLTNGNEIKMPNIVGYSAKDVNTLINLLNLKTESIGNGYVTSQSIPEGTILTDESILSLRFTTAPKEDVKEEEKKEDP